MSTDSSSSSRSSSADSAYDRRRRPSSRYEVFRRASQPLDEQVDQQTWSEFLRDADEDIATRSESPRDRKRRLTGPSEDGRRGRGIRASPNTNTITPNHSAASLPPTPPRPAFVAGQGSSSSQASFYDLTTPSSPPPHPQFTRPSVNARHSSLASPTTDYVVPKWQPDSEVTHCPICKSQFTFWFRKHHCRKCGRVVCATCSPHRITIPRQFIVHPPENKRASTLRNEPIDLTHDDTENSGEEANMSPGQPRNPALGGGEEVRLCRPCVPDPQPAPPRNSSFAPDLRRVHHFTNGIPLDRDHNPVPGLPRQVGLAEHHLDRRSWERDWQNHRDSLPPRHPRRHSSSLVQPPGVGLFQVRPDEGQRQRDFRRQRGRGMIFQPEGTNLNAIRTGSDEIPEEGLPRYGAFNYTVVPRYTRPGLPPGYSAMNDVLPAPPEYSLSSGTTSSTSGIFRNSLPAPGTLPPPVRRPSNFAPGRPLPNETPQALPGGRPRVRSMFDPRTSSASSSTPRVRIPESDICPICYRLLPPVGPSGSEADREQHIADCISSREAASSPRSSSQSFASSGRAPFLGSLGQRQSLSSPHPGTLVQPPTAPEITPQMLPFRATEKDCLGQDGSAQECSICMVEYDVGDPLARLECLCCFHESCIRSWFERKKECPVHKIA